MYVIQTYFQKHLYANLFYFFSLVKMVYGFAAESDDQFINSVELEQAIRRNFSGLDDLNPMQIFSRHISQLKHCYKVNITNVYEIHHYT